MRSYGSLFASASARSGLADVVGPMSRFAGGRSGYSVVGRPLSAAHEQTVQLALRAFDPGWSRGCIGPRARSLHVGQQRIHPGDGQAAVARTARWQAMVDSTASSCRTAARRQRDHRRHFNHPHWHRRHRRWRATRPSVLTARCRCRSHVAQQALRVRASAGPGSRAPRLAFTQAADDETESLHYRRVVLGQFSLRRMTCTRPAPAAAAPDSPEQRIA